MANKGGKIAPDGRPPQAPGVGKDSKRHDLEAPATPGLHDSDLQQGDVQALERGQKIAPRPKKQMAAAQPQPRTQTTQSRDSAMSVPDPIEFAKGRIGGNIPSPGSTSQQVDPQPWMPLLEQLALRPNGGGGLASAYVEQLAAFRRNPVTSRAFLIDLNEADELLGA